ncbi:Serine/threonine-protein kinase PEPKR2 [Vitis vinifera]|uniref:Serine/threonine-protein kinase PEPKR2 n=1 Tax=Vitis vinifera TaxID=29760 RepID=A0A438C3K2_VITVI|nr:Serine/threonine-protein kinase PEPKR2 [Vitis vinifera]
MALMRKRKGSETDTCLNQSGVLSSYPRNSGSDLSVVRSHFSLEDYARLRKKCKEDVVKLNLLVRVKVDSLVLPPCLHVGSRHWFHLEEVLRGKIGCIDVATQMGRKNKIENDYALGETIVRTLKKGEETVHREVEIMQHLSGHAGIVTLRAVYEDPECFHLVMELCSGGRLVDQMVEEGQYSEHRAANILRELILVIKYCHDMGVVHRDIKPENILLTAAGKLKLADFGLAMRVAKVLNNLEAFACLTLML